MLIRSALALAAVTLAAAWSKGDELKAEFAAAAQKLLPLVADEKAAPEDRISLWMASNEPVQLTRGLVSPEAAKEALALLEKEYPSGATNLPKAIRSAAALFGGEVGRSRSVVLLGDGLSLANPLETEDRVQLGSELVDKRVVFHAVPMGPRMDPLNLHGLASASGGRCIRVAQGDAPATLADRHCAPIPQPWWLDA